MQITRRTFLLSAITVVISACGAAILSNSRLFASNGCILKTLIPADLLSPMAGSEIHINNSNIASIQHITRKLTQRLTSPGITSQDDARATLQNAALEEFRTMEILDVHGWILPETAVYTALWAFSSEQEKPCS